MPTQTEDLRRRIVADINAGEPGAKLGSERELAERYGTSRSSLRQVLAALQESGLIDRVIGRSGGIFISHAQVQRSLNELRTCCTSCTVALAMHVRQRSLPLCAVAVARPQQQAREDEQHGTGERVRLPAEYEQERGGERTVEAAPLEAGEHALLRDHRRVLFALRLRVRGARA